MPDWDEIALRSEIAYSRARGGAAARHDGFIHIHNKRVPWGGDYNRAVGCVVTDHASFARIEAELKKIHAGLGLEPPDRFDCRPPALPAQDWTEFLKELGYTRHDVLFFAAPARDNNESTDVRLYRPSENEYLERHERELRKADYFDEQWFREIAPLEKLFMRTFRPYWLMRDGTVAAAAHCAHLGGCSRLFAVEVDEARRGQGLGKQLLGLIRAEAQRAGSPQVLLQTTERLRPFYQKAGFAEVSRNTVIRAARTAGTAPTTNHREGMP
jgi:GNAT superfamily N-acetyltransferase